MTPKRHLLSLILILGLSWGTGPALAEGSVTIKYTPPAPAAAPVLMTPEKSLDQFLTAIRRRDRDRAFAALSASAQERYQKNSQIFMNTVRLDYGDLYQHQRVVTTRLPPMESGDERFQVDLYRQQGSAVRALLRLTREDDQGIWSIDRFTVLADQDGKNL